MSLACFWRRSLFLLHRQLRSVFSYYLSSHLSCQLKSRYPVQNVTLCLSTRLDSHSQPTDRLSSPMSPGPSESRSTCLSMRNNPQPQDSSFYPLVAYATLRLSLFFSVQ